MIFDTLALKAKIASEKELSEMSSHDIFNVMIDLKDRGLLNFDYELLTDGNGRKFNCPEHTLKHFIREICRKVLGMSNVNDDMVREVALRLKYYEDNAVVVAETEEFMSAHDPTIFLTLSMASSAAFDAGAPYKVMATTWSAGENGVAKQINPSHYASYTTGAYLGVIWTASISPGDAASIFNNIELVGLHFGGYKFKNIQINQYTNSSIMDLAIVAASIGAGVVATTMQGSATIVTDFAPRAADLDLFNMNIDNAMFGHINLSSGLVISWSKGGGDWD